MYVYIVYIYIYTYSQKGHRFLTWAVVCHLSIVRASRLSNTARLMRGFFSSWRNRWRSMLEKKSSVGEACRNGLFLDTTKRTKHTRPF